MSASHRAIAARLEALLDELGADYLHSDAGTGSIYLRIEPRRDLDQIITIRIANHSDARCTSTYSVDTAGLDGTPAGARAVILRALRTSEAAIRRLRRARRARRHREAMDYASRLRAHGHG